MTDKNKKNTTDKPKFSGVGVPVTPKPFANFKKPMFKGPSNFNTSFRTQNKGGK